MKRLKFYLLQMENSETTYQAMYDGTVAYPVTGKLRPERDNDPLYWHGDELGFTIERTHKLALDLPTVTIQIPCEKLCIERFTPAAADFCLRAFAPYISSLNAALYNRARPDRENGRYYLYSPGGEVLVRNSAYFAVCRQKDYVNGSGSMIYLRGDSECPPPAMCLCLRLQVQLPRRKIRKTIQMLCRDLPEAVALYLSGFDIAKLSGALALEETQEAIRSYLQSSEYAAFIANGSILARSKGTRLPMENAVPFQSVPEDEIELQGVRGMGIRRGVTVVTGGGYSGKSTLLDAISSGIYNHVAGDGRELCLTDPSAVKISAEDGRSVQSVNIKPFIKWVPGGDTSEFSTGHASGSTSQAANIMEAVAFGSKLLLIDEDKSATNFMIRDGLMKALIEKEPITPFTDRVNELHTENGVSTILVIGGSGEYLSVADKVYMMDDFRIRDMTGPAKRICNERGIRHDFPAPALWAQRRTLLAEGFTPFPGGFGSERLEVSDMGFILIGDERVDIRMMPGIVTSAQLDALGFLLRYLEVNNHDRKINIDQRIGVLYEKIKQEGLDCVYSNSFTACRRFLDLPRPFELLSVINRMRYIRFKLS